MPVIDALKTAIKQVENDKNKLPNMEALLALSVECNVEQILVGRKVKTVRRVYMCGNTKSYKVGWIVDGDISSCLICQANFSWVRLKHHCRACGLVVCHNCSKFKTVIQILMEEGGSRVCTNCFGLKVDIDPYYPKSPLTSPNGDNNGGSVSPRSSGKFSAIQQRKFVVIRRGKRSQVASDISSTTTTSSTSDTEPADETSVMFKKLQEFEQQQLPKYEEAYKYDYLNIYKIPLIFFANRTMRAIIPPHITKTKLKTIIKEGVPKDIAHRIWETKALWLICMHKDDIRKVEFYFQFTQSL
jgi:hypothetical protein